MSYYNERPGGDGFEDSPFYREYDALHRRHEGNQPMLDAIQTAAKGCLVWCRNRGVSPAALPAGMLTKATQHAASHNGDKPGGIKGVAKPRLGAVGSVRQSPIGVSNVVSDVVTRHRDGRVTDRNGNVVTEDEARALLARLARDPALPNPLAPARTLYLVSGDQPVGYETATTVYDQITDTSGSEARSNELTIDLASWLTNLGVSVVPGDPTQPYAHAFFTTLDGDVDAVDTNWADTLAAGEVHQRLRAHPIAKAVLCAVTTALARRVTPDIAQATPFITLSCLKTIAYPHQRADKNTEALHLSIRTQALSRTRISSNTRSVYTRRILSDLHRVHDERAARSLRLAEG